AIASPRATTALKSASAASSQPTGMRSLACNSVNADVRRVHSTTLVAEGQPDATPSENGATDGARICACTPAGRSSMPAPASNTRRRSGSNGTVTRGRRAGLASRHCALTNAQDKTGELGKVGSGGHGLPTLVRFCLAALGEIDGRRIRHLCDFLPAAKNHGGQGPSTLVRFCLAALGEIDGGQGRSRTTDTRIFS